MTETLIEGISKWLDEGGYPLELYVTNIFSKAGFVCSKSPFFTDTESQKPREVDTIAWSYAENERKESVILTLIIECKKSTNPFVVLCDKSEEDTLLKHAVFGNLSTARRDDILCAKAVLAKDASDSICTPYPTPLLDTKTKCGYTLLQAHQRSDANIYAEVYKLAKAYYYRLQKDDKFRRKVLKNKRDKQFRKEMKNSFYLHLPILVVDAPLVEAYLSDSGATEIEEKEASTIFIRLPWNLREDEGLAIPIITKSKVTDFANDIKNLAKIMVIPNMIDAKIGFSPIREEG